MVGFANGTKLGIMEGEFVVVGVALEGINEGVMEERKVGFAVETMVGRKVMGFNEGSVVGVRVG